MRTLSALGLLLALAGCGGAHLPSPASAEPQAAAPQSRSWQSDRIGRQVLTVTVFEDGTAILNRHGPPKMVPHWGELEIPDETEFATVRRAGGRTFLLVTAGTPRVLEIAERTDHLAVWFYAGNPGDGSWTDARLLALPGAAQPPDAVLATVAAPRLRQPPANPPPPATRFAI